MLVLCALVLAGCARQCEGCKRDVQTGTRAYRVESYSGGKLVGAWSFRGILNNQKNSDGYYFFLGDTLVEVGGDVIVKSTD